MSDSIRLHVFISQCGIASRRKCEEFILSNRVSVNGKIINVLGCKVSKNDIVMVDGKKIEPDEKIYVVLNKPTRYICSNTKEEGKPLAIELISPKIQKRLFHIGRLDYLSSGLILFTNDGEFANIIIHPTFEIEKDYIVNTKDKIPENILQMYQKGIIIDNIKYQLEKYRIINDHEVLLTLIEGKNREIRRVLKHFDLRLNTIHRIRIGNICLNGLKPGEFRHLTKQEIAWFYKKNK